jgi:1,2-dihydroxy-3-keto-5-methylthiopentene dioxygenase
MSTLTRYEISKPRVPVLHTRDNATISRVLKESGIRFEHWPVHPLPDDVDSAGVLNAYRAEIDKLKAEQGYTTADVVRLKPDHPDRDALRLKFIEEHTHTDDEVRFFAEGSGAFYLHLGDAVLQVICEAGDLISVPAGARHWFDMGPTPSFTAIRLFVSPEGWVGHFTGDPLSSAIPRLDGVAA